MKRTIALIIPVVAALSLCACAPANSNSTDSSAQTVSPKIIVSSEPTPLAPTQTPSYVTSAPDAMDTPNEESGMAAIRKDVDRMLPIMDSIVRVIYDWAESDYAPEDPVFFWRVLYLMGNNWSGTHPSLRTGDEWETWENAIPAQIMEEFAIAAFVNYELFPPIPENLQNAVKLDVERNTYLLSPSNMTGTIIKIEDVSVSKDGSVAVVIGVYDATDAPEYLMKSFLVTLVKNTFVDENSDAVYKYSVTDVTGMPQT